MALLWVAGVVAFTVFDQPFIAVTYLVSKPDIPPVRSDSSCKYGDNALEFVTVKTKKGTDAHVTLCFVAQTFSDGRKLIPYRVDRSTGQLWGNEGYSSDVKTYREWVKAGFVLDQAGETWIDGQWWPKRWKQVLYGALWLFGGLAFLWGLTWTIGWIMRGFLGIPRGQDRRPPEG